MKQAVLLLIVAICFLSGCAQGGISDSTTPGRALDKDDSNATIDPGEPIPGSEPTQNPSEMTREQVEKWLTDNGYDLNTLNLDQIKDPQGDTDGDGIANYQDADPFDKMIGSSGDAANAAGLNAGGPNLMSMMMSGMYGLMMPMMMMQQFSMMKHMLGGANGASGASPVCYSPAIGQDGQPIRGNALPVDARRLLGNRFSNPTGMWLQFREGNQFSWHRGTDIVSGMFSINPAGGIIAFIQNRRKPCPEAWTFNVQDAECKVVEEYSMNPQECVEPVTPVPKHLPLIGFNPIAGMPTCLQVPGPASLTGVPSEIKRGSISEVLLIGIHQRKGAAIGETTYHYTRVVPPPDTQTCNDTVRVRADVQGYIGPIGPSPHAAAASGGGGNGGDGVAGGAGSGTTGAPTDLSGFYATRDCCLHKNCVPPPTTLECKRADEQIALFNASLNQGTDMPGRTAPSESDKTNITDTAGDMLGGGGGGGQIETTGHDRPLENPFHINSHEIGAGKPSEGSN